MQYKTIQVINAVERKHLASSGDIDVYSITDLVKYYFLTSDFKYLDMILNIRDIEVTKDDQEIFINFFNFLMEKIINEPQFNENYIRILTKILPILDYFDLINCNLEYIDVLIQELSRKSPHNYLIFLHIENLMRIDVDYCTYVSYFALDQLQFQNFALSADNQVLYWQSKILKKIATEHICSPIFDSIIMEIYSDLFIDFRNENFQINPYIIKVFLKTELEYSVPSVDQIKQKYNLDVECTLLLAEFLTRFSNLQAIIVLLRSITYDLSNKERKIMLRIIMILIDFNDKSINSLVAPILQELLRTSATIEEEYIITLYIKNKIECFDDSIIDQFLEVLDPIEFADDFELS